MPLAILCAIPNWSKFVSRVKVTAVMEKPNSVPVAANFHRKVISNGLHWDRQIGAAVLKLIAPLN
jgi:hypothetical protein